MNKETYLTEYPKHESMRENVKKDKNRLHFHMMPPTGWMNDPNGLCEFQGVNHIYFQYTPFLAGWGTKLWGHYTTKDWIHYKEEEPFLYPDEEWDRDGVYSGSAYTCEDGIHYFYTGNVKLWDKDSDYIINICNLPNRIFTFLVICKAGKVLRSDQISGRITHCFDIQFFWIMITISS